MFNTKIEKEEKKLFRSGNSIVVRLPKLMCDELNINENTVLNLTLKLPQNKIEVSKVRNLDTVIGRIKQIMIQGNSYCLVIPSAKKNKFFENDIVNVFIENGNIIIEKI